MNISVVIPTAGGRAGVLERSLRVLLADPMTSEALVVLDGADALTEEVISRAQAVDPRVVAVEADHDRTNLDRGQLTRTTGARAARGEVIVALDDDVDPEPGLVSGHACRHADDERLVVVGYMPVALPSGRRGAIRATARLYGEVYERECRMYEASPESILLGLWGGNMSVRRDAWLAAAAGAAIGNYHADREFGLRLRALGLHAAFDRQLRAAHHYRRTASRLLDDALSSGSGHAAIQAAHDELGPLPRTRAGPRSLLWGGRSRVRTRAVGRCLALAADAAAVARIPRVEDSLVRAIWAVGFSRALAEADRVS